MKNSNSRDGCSTFFGLLAVVFFVWLIVPLKVESKFLYSVTESVDYDNVYMNDQPSDCDFWRAPIGIKGCHYDRVVETRLVRTTYQLPLTTTPCEPNDTGLMAGGSAWMWTPQGTVCLAPTVPEERISALIAQGYSRIPDGVVEQSISQGYTQSSQPITQASDDGGKTWVPDAGDKNKSSVWVTWKKVDEQ
jgi:hypothetical protein